MGRPLLLAAALLGGFGVVTGTSFAAEAKDDCLEAYNKASNQKGVSTFYGYGVGYGDADAVDNARADLAKQIRTRVESSASLRETEKVAEFNALTTSTVSEKLMGLKVQKRCPSGVKSSAFVSLDKTVLVAGLREGIGGGLTQANALLARAEASSKAVEHLRLLRELRAFLAGHKGRISDDLALCKALQACGEVNAEALQKLANHVEANRRLLTFYFRPADPVATKLRQDLVKILNRDGIEVSEQAGAQEMRVACDSHYFPKVPDIAERYLEVRCRGEASVDKDVAFTLNFTGSGAGVTEDLALDLARSQLQLDETAER